MKITERCSCGAEVEADDQPMLVSNRGSLSDMIDRGTSRYTTKDGNQGGTGYAADFVERWRDQHVCPVEEPKNKKEA